MTPVRLLDGALVRRLLTPALAHASQRDAFLALGSGRTGPTPRVSVAGSEGSSAFSLTARLGPDQPVVNKFGGVHPANVDRQLPVIAALVTVLDAQTGRPVAIMDGTALTELRTAAASAVAAEALASSATRCVVAGAGVQGAAHLRALAYSHPAAELGIWARDLGRAEDVAAALAGELGRPVAAYGELAAAVLAADLVVLCTSASAPLFLAEAVAPGTTVISIGSFAPDRHEVSQALLERSAAVVVDDRAVALEHCGPVITAVADGRLRPDDLVELGSVLSSPFGRAGRSDVVTVLSVGVGVQDAAAATVVATTAATQDLGQLVEL